MIRKFFQRLRRLFGTDRIPAMIWGYTDASGRKLPQVRISNTTYLGNPENLQLGNHVFIGHFSMIDASNGLTIEEGCQITNYVSILTHSSHISIRLYGNAYTGRQNHAGYVKGSVVIGKYSFIGPHTVIMPGTTIGKGCMVSAYSYVNGAFPDFSIIAGNPAVVTGDTRKLDQPYLDLDPVLKKWYNQWSQ